MDWLSYILIFAAICVVYFFITRIWVGGIDLIIDGIKKIFRLNKNESTEKWHTIEELRAKNKDNEQN